MTPGEPRPENPDSRWRGLYLAGGAAALITAFVIPLQMVVFILWPPPFDGTVADWFAAFQANPLHGLLSLDLLMMVDQVLVVAIVLALYVALHRTSESIMAIATAGWLVAATLFIASNTAFEMLSLSQGYAAASSDGARATFLAAGQAMLASYWDKGTAFDAGYVLTALAGLLIGLAMLRSQVFSRVSAWALVVSNIVGLGIYIPVVGVPLSLLSVIILWVWYVLVGRRLIAIARQATPETVVPTARPIPAAAS